MSVLSDGPTKFREHCMKLVVLMTGILEELKWETLQKRRKDNRLILLYKGLKSKARIPTDDLIQRTGVAEINSQWSFRFPLQVKMPTRKASFHKLSGTGMSSLIL